VAANPQVLGAAQTLINDKTVEVREADYDVDTGIDLQRNDRLVFSANGSIFSGVVLTQRWGPSGAPRFADDPSFPLMGAHKFSLLAKADGHYEEIGQGAEVIHSGQDARLFLRINDDRPGNGNGSFNCRIQHYR